MKIITKKALISIFAMLSIFGSCEKESIDPPEILAAQEIIDNCAEAMGGYEVINNISTLHIKSIYPDHGNTPMEIIIKLPNKSYNPGSTVIVFDGERIFFPYGMDGNSGTEYAPEGDWKDGEVEIGYYFPAFFEHSAEYIGYEKTNNKYYYKLKVSLPLGADLTYFVDTKTFFTAKVQFTFNMSGTEIDDWRDLGDYQDIDGFIYPHSFTYNSRSGRQNGKIHSIDINVSVDDSLFEIPEE